MFEEGSPEEQMLQQAMDAVRRGDRKTARDLLTRLIKTDQNNATYWLWMSAAMETAKERIYCLQTALKLDPNNVAAKRGLVMHGALPPDDSIPPFPLNRPRPWEDQVVVAGEEDRPRGFKALWANPVTRLGMIVVGGVVLLGVTLLSMNQAQRFIPAPTRTPGPSPTYTATVTLLPTPSPFIRTPTATFVGPTPLAAMLAATYTPTPLYIDTPHPLSEAYRAGLRYLADHDYSGAVQMLDQVIFNEPNAGDAYYYKGVSQLLQEDYAGAQETFEEGIQAAPDFAPNYVGYASARLQQSRQASVLDDLDKAISLDPDFPDTYLVRARYHLQNDDPATAKEDAEAGIALAPKSPLGYVRLAEVSLALGENEAALEAALTANSLDSTLLDVYRLLGLAYIASEQAGKAVGPLQTYTLYNPDDREAIMMLGDAYRAADDYELAISTYTRALDMDPEWGHAYAKRAMAYLALGDGEKALDDLDTARLYLPTSLESSLLLAQALLLNDEPNNAYVQLLRAEGLVETDRERAEYLHWRALALEGMGGALELKAAANDWKELLALPEEAVPDDMRREAEQRLAKLETPVPSRTPTPRASATP